MPNIRMLRTMVDNGWTIANRKNIIAQFGEANFKKMVVSAKESNISYDKFKYDLFECNLNPRQHKTYIGCEEYIEEDFSEINAFKKLFQQNEFVKNTIKALPQNVNWNSDRFLLFKFLEPSYASQEENLKIILGTDNKLRTQLKDLLFKTCKPLGRSETHYRKESYRAFGDSWNHFKKIDSLNAGDLYTPKNFFWTSNNKNSIKNYGSGNKDVYYEIIYPEESRIIEYPLKTIYGDITEAISPRNSTYKILEKRAEGDQVYIKMQLVI